MHFVFHLVLCIPTFSSVLSAYTLIQRRFVKAMELVGGEFVGCVLRHRDVWLPARAIVQKAIEKRHEVCYSIMSIE